MMIMIYTSMLFNTIIYILEEEKEEKRLLKSMSIESLHLLLQFQ